MTTALYPEKILIVDDDSSLLEAMRRQFRREFDIHIALGGEEGLKVIQEEGPFAVVVSDQTMPGMRGVEYLSKVREMSPDTMRIMLTGYADLQAAMDAVNQGQIFRFLSKPVSRDLMRQTLISGIEQYRLVTSQRVLLSQTLNGSIKVLIEMLALVSPEAFGYSNNLKHRVQAIVVALKATPVWEYELAAMLCQIGCVTVPPEIMQKVQVAEPLGLADQLIYEQHVRVGYDLIAKIPRLERVAQSVLYQGKNFDGSGFPREEKLIAGDKIPLGARVLRAAQDYESWLSRGCSHRGAMQRLRTADLYDPQVLDAMETALCPQESRNQPSTQRILTLDRQELRSGMVVANDIRSRDGSVLLVRKGQEITDLLMRRLQNFSLHTPIATVIEIYEPLTPESSAANSAIAMI